MTRFSMAFDDPRINIAKQQLYHASHIKLQNLQAQKESNIKRGGDLKLPMIERVHRAKPGCSACGK